MRFTKIKWDQKEVTMKWVAQRGSEEHTHELTSKALPHADFDRALRALKDEVLDVLELDESYGGGLRVQSVTFSKSEKTGAAGAVVTSLKTLTVSTGPLVLNTPYMLEDGDQETGVMGSSMAEKLNTLRAEARAYIDGSKRGQGDLFGTSPAETDTNARADAGEPAGV